MKEKEIIGAHRQGGLQSGSILYDVVFHCHIEIDANFATFRI